MTQQKYFRGEIYFAQLPQGETSEQSGKRPVLIIQNNTGNKHSPTLIVAPLTSSTTKAKLPTHVAIRGCGLRYPSVVLCEQVVTISKSRLSNRVGEADEATLQTVDKALRISLGLS